MFPVFYQKLDWVHSHCRCWCSSLLCQTERVNGSSGFEIVKCLPSTHTIHRLNNKMKMSHPCHTYFKERFSETFDKKAVTYLIFFVGMLCTPARSHVISGLKSRVLKLAFLASKMMVKSGLEFILKFTKPLQRYLLTYQANSAIMGRFFDTGQQEL